MKIFFLFSAFIYMLLICAILSCSSVKIIEHTENTAIIQGFGATKIEAKKEALNKALELFKNVEELQEPKYAQEYKDSDKANEESSQKNDKTYWSCIIYVGKM